MSNEDSFLSSFKGTMGVVFAIGFCILAFAGVSCAGCLGLAAMGRASMSEEEKAAHDQAQQDALRAAEQLQQQLDGM